MVLEASPEGFIILCSIRNIAGEINDFSIEYINPTAAREVNRTPQELLEQNLLQVFPDCKTAAHQRTSNILESITNAFVAFDRDSRYTYVNQEAALWKNLR